MPQDQVVYLYHTGPGYLLCMMRVVGVAWVVYSTYVTLLKFETKRRFFKRFAFIFSAWLLGLPFIVLIALSTPSWVRAKVSGKRHPSLLSFPACSTRNSC